MTPDEVPAELVQQACRAWFEDGGWDMEEVTQEDLDGCAPTARAVLAAVLPEAIAMGHDEAADVVHAEARFQTELAMRRSLGNEYAAQRMGVVEKTIRGFAARWREEKP